MRMKMTNDDNDNDSSNVNETIKTFYFFYEKFYKHKVVFYIEVIRPILNIFFFFYEKISHAQKTQKSTKSTKTHISKQKRQHFYALKNI